MNKETKLALPIFIIGFAIRCVAAGVTTVTDLNPDSRADAVGFGRTAENIARGLLEGQPYLFTTGPMDIYQLWGSFLAPFWLLPGPSSFYARLGNAFLGAFAIYNVYILVRYYHSHHAGVVATLPMMFYPSFIAVHSTLLREAIVLFGITTAVRLLMVSSQKRPRILTYIIASIVLYIAYIQRTDNAIIYGAAIGSALIVYAVQSGQISKRAIGVGIALSPIALVFCLPFVRDGVEFLARTRELRARGRAVYLPDVVPRTVLELGAFSWVGAAYFLYAPFPWMIQTIPDLLVSVEGLVSIGFTVTAVWGVRSLGRKNAPATIGLMVGLAVATVLYGTGTVNYGTGMRHRQMFLWIIFLFGGIGITEYMRFEWPFHWNSATSAESRTETP